ncbi:LuxR C-terminal-related transcriptional regulator [Desulfonema magnum]|uniref:Transcriptional regulator LuxR domain-containing protein n=1 Tax=Desulfonema magnum TaxID=45655 RepID=A0A975BXZ6_9BACT|nr:LuxR C-terminal-related transcriptional regulator [Desulfonema magnum]QTA93906.1 Transcriptional regulator LuxR domain-containing protein [Desulfonema magnum]
MNDHSPSNKNLLKKIQIPEQESRNLKHTETHLKECPANAILNSLSAHIAILDEEGIILETNQSWKAFALENQVNMRPDMIGVNYLELCDNVRGDGGAEARVVSDGIREVISGKTDEFVTDYACHSPSERRWFYMRATRLSYPGPLKIVVSHENITALKLAEESLRDRKKELRDRARDLDEVNTALKILLRQREADRKELEEKVVSNVSQLVIPYIEKMMMTRLDSRQKEYIKILKRHLDEIVSPFLHHISSKYQRLTPREIEIASLIRGGNTTKEIAMILNVSESAIDFHRKNIRKKFGLTNNKANLRAYLLSLS